MVTPLRSDSRATSTDNLLAPPPLDEGARGQQPLITMGDSAESEDSAGPMIGFYHSPGRCMSLTSGEPSEAGATRSAPEIEMHIRCGSETRTGYKLLAPRCSCSNLPRAPSHESIRSVKESAADLLVITPSTNRDRIIRQHSQPETCLHCHHPKPSGSLRGLEHSPGEGISNIVADSLRINGALRHFKQVRKSPVTDHERFIPIFLNGETSPKLPLKRTIFYDRKENNFEGKLKFRRVLKVSLRLLTSYSKDKSIAQFETLGEIYVQKLPIKEDAK